MNEKIVRNRMMVKKIQIWSKMMPFFQFFPKISKNILTIIENNHYVKQDWYRTLLYVKKQ